MTSRVGDYSDKRYLYKVYKRGYSSSYNKYIDTASGQYIATTVNISSFGIPAGSLATGTIFSSPFSAVLTTSGSGGAQAGTITSDPIRQIDIEGVTATFRRGHANSAVGASNKYYAQLFAYKVLFDVDATQVKLYKNGVLTDTQTLSSSYDYIRIREESGTLYIERSSNGTSWTSWNSFVIDYDTDIIESQLVFGFDFATAGAGFVDAAIYDVLITDRANQFLALEDQVIDALKFTTNINTPASTTTLKLNYSPLEVPEYLEIGNNIEVYANFYNWADKTLYEPILDENSDPILDENSEPIYGISYSTDVPETISNLRFAGYIEDIEYNYDDDTISLKLVSHGELLANTLVHGSTIDVSVVSQLLDDSTYSDFGSGQYQTVQLDKQTKIDRLAFKFGSGAGGAAKYEVRDSSGTLLGSSYTLSWSGSLSTDVWTLSLANSITVDAGTYRIVLVNSGSNLNIRYQSTDVYTDGSWSGGAGDMYFNIITRSPDYDETFTGDSDSIIDSAVTFLEQNYTLLYKGDVDTSSFSVSIQSNVDTVGSLIDNLNKQMDTGWWWHIDPGTGEIRFKSPHTTPDHLLVLGRDFVGFKLNKSIANIKNQAIFTGGEIATNAKLTVAQTDTDSIADYKYGLSLESNEKVTRYDSAGLIVSNTIANNNAPRYTTEITVSAALYDIETFRIGDIVKIQNGDDALNDLNLQIASLQYSPDEVTLSLDTAPANINRTVEALKRELHNQATANATGAV